MRTPGSYICNIGGGLRFKPCHGWQACAGLRPFVPLLAQIAPMQMGSPTKTRMPALAAAQLAELRNLEL
jgi:hypothetical protein